MASTHESDRWKIILAWKEHGSIKGAARALSMPRSVVQRWVQRFNSTGGVEKHSSKGRSPALAGAAAEKALELLLAEGCSGADSVAQQLHSQGTTSKKLHKTTIIRAATRLAKAKGTPIKHVRSKPAKQLTAATQRKRLQFALANKSRDWRRVMFTDRKKFLLCYPGVKVNPTGWVPQGSTRQALTVNHPQCINLYAGITSHGVTSCHTVAGSSKHKTTYKNKQGTSAKNITAAEYKSVLESTLLPEGTRLFSEQGITHWVLQQDNDPSHGDASSSVKKWTRQGASNVELLLNWPPNSPDLSPIENVWSYVQSRVNAKGCKNLGDFQQAVQDEMRSVPRDMLEKLFSSMPRRMALVIERGGDKTGY
jgi:transposase